MKKEKSRNLWPLKITICTFFLSISINVITSLLIERVSILLAFLVLVCVVLIGIVFDIIGIAVTSASEIPFHSRNAKGIKGAKESINLIRNAEKVSNICNDVIGDTVGIVSGGLAGAIVVIVASNYHKIDSAVLNLVLAGLVAALTVGGKAAGKTIAINKSYNIINNAGIVIYYIKKIFSFNIQKGKKKRKNDK